MRPTLKQLDYLIALKHEGSFSKAAEFCHVTQSTLSAGIKELETILGQILVDRTTRELTLTPIGEDIYHHARKITLATDQLVAQARRNEDPLSGVLRLGVIPTIAPYMLPRILPALQKQYPDLDIQLFEDLTERLTDQLLRRKLDLLLMAFPFDADGIEHHIMFEEPFVIAAPQGAFIQNSVPLDFLSDKSVLLLEDGHCLRDQAIKACKLQKTPQKKTFSATSLPTLIQMVAHGYGMTLLPEMATHKDSLPAYIDILHFQNPPPTRQIGLAWRKGNPFGADYQKLAAYIEKLCV